MMRVWFFILLVLLTSVSFLPRAHAVTQTTQPNYIYNDGKSYSSPQAYCDTQAGQWIPSTFTNTTADNGLCYNSGGTLVSGWSRTAGATCPATYTYNSTTKLCERQACDVGQVTASGFFDVGVDQNSNGGAPTLTYCSNGCSSVYQGGSVSARALVSGTYHYYAQGNYVTDGFTCTGNGSAPVGSAAPPADTCAANQNAGTVNGKMVCTAADGTAANPNGTTPAGTTTTNNSTTNTTTNTTTTNTSNGTYSTSTSTSTTNNTTNNPPADPAAKCDPFNPTVACMNAGTAPPDSIMPTKTLNVSITPVAVGGVGYCPAPLPFTIAGRQGQLDFTTYCNYAGMVRPLILAFAWLTAAGLLIGGFKTEG